MSTTPQWEKDKYGDYIFAVQDGCVVAIPKKSFENGTSFQDSIPIKDFISLALQQEYQRGYEDGQKKGSHE